MPIEVTMPKLSPTMETGVIAQWLVKVGDQIKEGDVLADIETDKATMPMKSYDDGTIVHIDHAAGDEVALGQRVMVLAKKGEDPKQVAASLGVGGGASVASPTASPGPPAGSKAAPEPGASPAPRPASARAASDRIRRQRPAGAGRRAGSARRLSAQGQPAGAEARRVVASRSGQVRGSGPGGRIVRRDVEEFTFGKPSSRAARADRGASWSRRQHRSPGPPLAPPAAGRDPALADAQDDRPADGPGQAGRARDPPDRRHPRRSPRRRTRRDQQAPRPRRHQALAGRLRHQGRGPGPAVPPRRQCQLRARRDRPPCARSISGSPSLSPRA